MSFGRPGTLDNFKVTPPARGSFPLDHDGQCSLHDKALLELMGMTGECRDFMLSYLKCLKANKSNGGDCRVESRNYLQCRMDKWVWTMNGVPSHADAARGLMQKDDMANLGLGDVGTSHAGPTPVQPPESRPGSQDRIV